MKNKFIISCLAVVVVAVICTVGSVGTSDIKTDVSTATAQIYYAEKEAESTTGSVGGVLEAFLGGNNTETSNGVGNVVESVGSDYADGLSEMLGDFESDLSGGLDSMLGDNSSGNSDDADSSGDSGYLGGLGDIFGGDSGSSGGLGDIFGGDSGSSGGLGGAFSGIGDTFGGLFGGVFGDDSAESTTEATTEATTAVATTSYDSGLITPVPAATQTPTNVAPTYSITPAVTEAPLNSSSPDLSAGVTTATSGSPATGSSSSGSSGAVTEAPTVVHVSNVNPYTKPTQEFKEGDEDESIKWLQWIFMYTKYGLGEDDITGVLDENTVAVVKKLQLEKGLTVDGNINEEVVESAELLFYQYVLGANADATAADTGAVLSETTDAAGVSQGSDKATVVLLIVILVIIWVLAIGGIILLFFLKKKKLKAKANKEDTTDETAEENNEKKTNKDGQISSLTDLFEEANKE